MGAFLDKPKTEKYNESQAGAGLRYGLSSMQGWRIEMEDAHSALIGIPEIGDKARSTCRDAIEIDKEWSACREVSSDRQSGFGVNLSRGDSRGQYRRQGV